MASDSSSDSGVSSGVIIGASVALSVAFLILVLTLFFVHWMRKRRNTSSASQPSAKKSNPGETLKPPVLTTVNVPEVVPPLSKPIQQPPGSETQSSVYSDTAMMKNITTTSLKPSESFDTKKSSVRGSNPSLADKNSHRSIPSSLSHKSKGSSMHALSERSNSRGSSQRGLAASTSFGLINPRVLSHDVPPVPTVPTMIKNPSTMSSRPTLSSIQANPESRGSPQDSPRSSPSPSRPNMQISVSMPQEQAIPVREQGPPSPTGKSLVNMPKSNLSTNMVHSSSKLNSTTGRSLLKLRTASVMEGTQNTFTLLTHTVTFDEKELSIPLYLEMNFDEDVEIGDRIAQTSRTIIYRGILKNEQLVNRVCSSDCALKCFAMIDDNALLQEVALMEFFHNNNYFAQLAGFSLDKLTICVKYYQLGTLKRWIHIFNCVPAYSSDQVCQFAFDLASGFRVMHNEGFLHSDIKPDNVLLEQRGDTVHAVITDLGSARIIDHKTLLVRAFQVVEKNETTVSYAAPEILRRLRDPNRQTSAWNLPAAAAKAIDVFSFGIVLAEMLTRRKPYREFRDPQSIAAAIIGGVRPTFSNECLENIKSHAALERVYRVYLQCITDMFDERPTFNMIYTQLRLQ